MNLSLHNISPKYISVGERSEIWGREFEINSSDHLQVVAPSGSGKTSLIHFIYGIRNDYEGRILIEGRDIKSISHEKKGILRREKISIVFQDLKLFEDRTAFENIEVKRKLNPYHNEDEITAMAKRLGVTSKLSQIIRTCSYGEQQRIAIIRALMQPFELLLLDEPFSHLDEENRQKAFELISEECSKRNATMLLADLKRSSFLENEKTLSL